jgi:hypothetical protein
VDHFTDKPKKHYKEVQIKFVAPAAQPQVCKGNYKIVARSSVAPVATAEIAVIKNSANCPVGEWGGTITFTQTRTIEGENYSDAYGNESYNEHGSRVTEVQFSGTQGTATIVYKYTTHHTATSKEICGDQTGTQDLLEEATGSKAVTVSINVAQDGSYTIGTDWPSFAGKHTETVTESGCSTNSGPTPTTVDQSFKSFLWDTNLLRGKIDPTKPNMLDGRVPKSSPIGSSIHNTTNSGTEDFLITWHITRQ